MAVRAEGTALSVTQFGMSDNPSPNARPVAGTSPKEVREDYPYLDDEDLEFATLYAVAYPRVGRPREASSPP